MDVTFYRRINNGKTVMCRAMTLLGAKREITRTVAYIGDHHVLTILDADLSVLSTREGINGKWEDVK